MNTVVFDVNGTLSDLRPLAGRFEDLGAPAALMPAWFAATLRDGIALAAAGDRAPFADVAREALRTVWHQQVPGLKWDLAEAAGYVLAGFEDLGPHADVAPGARALATAGHRLVTLTNGSPGLTEGLLQRAGVRDLFWKLLGADESGHWKPRPEPYHYAARECGCPPADLTLVAVHPWDLHGAARAGLRTAYLNRDGTAYPSTFARPDHEITTIEQLADVL